MRKLATLIGSLVCLSVMKKPKTRIPTKVVNYYFVKKGCSGSCGGHCGKH